MEKITSFNKDVNVGDIVIFPEGNEKCDVLEYSISSKKDMGAGDFTYEATFLQGRIAIYEPSKDFTFSHSNYEDEELSECFKKKNPFHYVDETLIPLIKEIKNLNYHYEIFTEMHDGSIFIMIHDYSIFLNLYYEGSEGMSFCITDEQGQYVNHITTDFELSFDTDKDIQQFKDLFKDIIPAIEGFVARHDKFTEED